MMTNVFQGVRDQFPHLAYAGQSIDSVNGFVFPQELAHIQNAVIKRQREFIAGRILVRQACRRLGCPEAPVLADARRCPVWPSGMVGSISHTDEYCGAAVGLASQYQSIGFDVEQIYKVKSVLWPTFCTVNELNKISALPLSIQQKHAALVFSAKESFYKCHFQLHRLFFLFTNLEIDWNWGTSQFTISILNTNIPPLSIEKGHIGFMALDRNHVYTLVIQNT